LQRRPCRITIIRGSHVDPPTTINKCRACIIRSPEYNLTPTHLATNARMSRGAGQGVRIADQQRLIAISMSPKFGQSWLIQSPIPVLHARKSWQPFPQPVALAALPLDQLIPLGQPLSACNSAQGIPIPARMASQQCIAPRFVA
jgi:hypothetical protein